jgi:hypothetical protein
MVRNLFPNFLNDPAEYAAAERYWESLWSGVDQIRRRIAGWETPWLATRFADGTPMLDGNPIFSAASMRQARGVRAIQYAPQGDELVFDYWLGLFGASDIADPNAVVELVIACALSDQSAVLAQILMDAWVAGELRYELSNGQLALIPGGQPPTNLRLVAA